MKSCGRTVILSYENYYTIDVMQYCDEIQFCHVMQMKPDRWNLAEVPLTILLKLLKLLKLLTLLTLLKLLTLLTLLTLSTLFILFILFTLFTLFTLFALFV